MELRRAVRPSWVHELAGLDHQRFESADVSVPSHPAYLQSDRQSCVRSLALILSEIVTSQAIPVAFDQTSSTLGTIGILPLHIVDVPHEDIMQASRPCDVISFDQFFVRCIRMIEHPEVWMKGAEVNRYIRTKILKNPITHLLEFVGRVIFARDHQVRDFKPYIGLMTKIAERVEHRGQMRVGRFPVKLLSESLEIHVRRIHMFEERSSSFRRNVAGRDRDRLEIPLVASDRRIDCVFCPNHRIVIGKGDALAAVIQGRLGDRFR